MRGMCKGRSVRRGPDCSRLGARRRPILRLRHVRCQGSAGRKAGALHDWMILGRFRRGASPGIARRRGVTIAAAFSTPGPTILPDEREVNVACYLDGYEKEARRKNTGSAALGAVAGMGTLAVVVAVIYAATLSSIYSFGYRRFPIGPEASASRPPVRHRPRSRRRASNLRGPAGPGGSVPKTE
jgi:hypothetical protein